jgi:hypothetical protein
MSIFSDIAEFFGGETPDYSQAAFSPYNVYTPYGRARFNTDTGEMRTRLSPELDLLYRQFLSGASGLMPTEAQLAFGRDIAGTGQGLFGTYTDRLNQALNYDVNQATSDYYNQVQNVLAPQRAAQESQLADTLFKMGRTGAAVGVDGGYVNPEQFALLKAREQQNAEIALSAEERARAIRANQIAEATGGMSNALGLFGTGTNLPASIYGSALGLTTGAMEIPKPLFSQLGYGIQAGQAQANAGANMAQLQQAQNQSNLGFWGGLLGAGATALTFGGAGGGWGGLTGAASGGTSVPINFSRYASPF